MGDKKTESNETTKKSVHEKVERFEKKVDKAVEWVEEKFDRAVGEPTKESVHHFSQKLDHLIDDIEWLAESLDDIAHSALPEQHGTTTTFSANYDEHVSRLFIFRFLWLLIEYRILVVWSVRISIITLIHIIYMLFYGRRNKNLWDRQIRFLRHLLKRQTYIFGVTDKRPDFISK